MTTDSASEKAADRAWREYKASLDELRSRMLGREECRHPRVREQALYDFQTMITGGNQMYVQPRTDYPAFYVFWGPYELLWGGPAPDMIYSMAFIDGRRTYRVWGRAGTTCVKDFQLFAGHLGDETRSASICRRKPQWSVRPSGRKPSPGAPHRPRDAGDADHVRKRNL